MILDPIVTNPKIATAAITGGIVYNTFQPIHIGHGTRGMFDWSFRYQWLPLRPYEEEGKPHELPCVAGSSYAIRRDHFFHLGGYDDNLIIWNGENYEISLKLWLCSDGILEIPCSRAYHLSKLKTAYRKTDIPVDFVGKNLKRIAEVRFQLIKEFHNINVKASRLDLVGRLQTTLL